MDITILGGTMSRKAYWKDEEFKKDPFYQLLLKYTFEVLDQREQLERAASEVLKMFEPSNKETDGSIKR